MKPKTYEHVILYGLLVLSLGTLPFLLSGSLRRQWFMLYLFNAMTNGVFDKMINTRNIVVYPVRLLPKCFKTNILFDYLMYPAITVFFNRLTYNNQPLTIIYKWLMISIPMLLIEIWAERKSNLIKWNKNWKWHNTYLSISAKSLSERLLSFYLRKVLYK
ncbi:CBO0543 family protein [Halalkalibacter urbisdiaboli]|uniref:CBO0543 family protein n=1 Tax=Halalkalibacter urbisdiaboli TaxID=1960589 RepID=UPI000B42EF69|nr:CBO0543 family protein [Halalkalibacter urbisdiaboli]